jgi:hypothetical protein
MERSDYKKVEGGTKGKKKLRLQHHLSLIYILSKTKTISTSEKQKTKKKRKLCMRTQHVYTKNKKREEIRRIIKDHKTTTDAKQVGGVGLVSFSSI